MLLTASQCNLMSMQTLFILCILLYSSNARKVKRDVNDLKNDPVLSSVFPSDVLEKRKDRSISTIDESFGRTENVFNKRQTIADFDNNLRFGNGPLGRDTFSSSITPFFPDSPDAKMYSSQPMISNPISLPEVSNMNDDMTSTEERIPAVNPALFAANYLPLPGSDGATTQQLGFQETKRTFIPHKENINQPTEVKSAIAKHSAPLQLHIHSPNNKLRGIVPHVPEYGETVESIRQMQKETAWKRNFIPYVQRPQQLAWSLPFFKMAPQTMYSNEIYKRNSIPHPPTEHRRITKRSKGAKTSSKSKSSKKKSGKKKSAKKSNTSPEKSADDTKRQYIAQPQPFMYPSQFNTYLPTLDQNTYALQQNIMQQQPYVNNYQPNRAAATQVQNLDGMITRPLISNEPCSDQYITCADFAKNNYCTDYPELMKIQCRKSCRYCIATPDQENSTSSVDHPLLKQSNVAQSVSNDTSSAAKDTKATTTHKNETLVSNNESLEGSGSGDSDSGSGSGGDNDDKVDTYVADTTQKSQSTIKKSAGKSLKNEGKNDNIMAVSQVVSSKQTQKPSKKEKLPKVDTTLSSLKNATSPKNLSSSQTPDTSSGSGMSDESGESQSGSGSDSNILGSKKSNIKIVTPSKEERNKIWQPKESPEHNLGEFSLPVKKNSIPMPSLNIANMKSTSDDSSDSGSGSGESGDESGSEASSDTEKSKGNIVVADNQKETTAGSKKNPDKAVLIQKTKPENKKLKSSKKSEKQKPSVYSVPKKEQQLTIKPQRQSKGRSSAKDSSSSAGKTKNPKKPRKTKTQKKKISKEPKKKEKINKTIKKENTTHKKDTKTRKKSEKSKKAQIPAQPALGSAYPRIDLKSIASALAHYEEAALELAGEYPNPSSNIDITEYQRSMIPHPSTRQVDNMDRYRQNIQIAKILQNERLKKNTIPDFLKVSSDAKKTEPDSESVDADNLDLVRQRFNVPGVEPTLNDYYAETGKLNPFEKKKKSVKKSRIENEKRMKKFRYFEQDPYEYLRNMAPGASMEPIEDPKARSVVPPDHSFPVMLMKVSPGEEKYLPEDASKRGKIRKLNAEGLPIEDDSQKPSPPATAPAESRHSVPEVPPPPQPMPYYPLPPQPLQSPFENVAAQNQAMLQFPPQSFVEQNSAPQVNAALVKQPPADVEQQTNHMRSKMLSAFFSVKDNIPEDAGSGGGEAIGKDSIPIDSVGSGSIDVTPSKKTISLQSLLFKDDVTKTSQPNEKAKAQESPSQQEGFSNYLQSNLAALTPENIKSGGVDTGASPSAEFTTKMSKTQETNWMRPNAESELASALPSASDTSTKLNDEENAMLVKTDKTSKNIENSFENDGQINSEVNGGITAQYSSKLDLLPQNRMNMMERPSLSLPNYPNKQTFQNQRSQATQRQATIARKNNRLIPFFMQEQKSFHETKYHASPQANVRKGAPLKTGKGQRKTIMPYAHQIYPTPSLISKFKISTQKVSIDRVSKINLNGPSLKADDLPPATDFIRSSTALAVRQQGARRIHTKTQTHQRKPYIAQFKNFRKTQNRKAKPLENFIKKLSQTVIKNKQQVKQARKTFRNNQNKKQAISTRVNNIAPYNAYSFNTIYRSPAQYMMFTTTEKDKSSRFLAHPMEKENIQPNHIVDNSIIREPQHFSNTYHQRTYALPALQPGFKHDVVPLRSTIDSNDQATIIESFLQSNDQSSYGIADALYDRSNVPHRWASPWRYATGNEAAALKQPLTKGLFAVEKHEQRTSVRDHVPKSPPLAESQPSLKQMKRKKDGKSSKSIKHKVINKNIFRFEVPKPPLNSPYLAMASAKDKIDKSLLTEFPKSPYTQKSTINQPVNLPFTNQPIPLYSPYTSPLTFPNSLARMNIPQALPAASQYSWQQYLPYNQNFASNHANRQYSSVESKSSIVHNEQSSSLAANIGAAKYAVTPQKSKPSKITSQNKAQYDGWNYLIQKSDNVKPLIMTTNERDRTVSVKNNTFVDQSNTKISNAVKKNLIKQEPGLECGADWEGAAGDFGTFCYKVIKTKVTFDDALKECRRLNSDLFSVLNAYENRYLEDNIRSKFWIGYRDKGMDGNWKWTDDSKSFYTNWASSSIADSPKSHDCVYIDGDEGKWKDESCLKKRPFLCKAKIDACPGGWKRLKLNSAVGCYKLFSEPRTWEDAEMMCQQKNSHLASVTSEDEQTMVFQVHSSKSFWIGFNDRESEGDWRWTDRITSSYTNWGEKSPNNGGVSCAVMTPHGKWRDQPCNEKNIFICKRKGPRPEKNDGLDDDGVLLPVARLLTNVDTAPSHVFDELAKSGQRPVVPLHFWPMLKTAKSGMAGNRPMAAHGDVRSVPGGVALDGVHSFLDGGDFHGKCLTDPDKCTKGFAIAIQVYFADNVRKYEKPHCVVDTSGGGKGFTIFIAKNKLNYRVKLKDISWELRTDLIVERWQELVMTWHRSKGISVYVNGAFKDSESVGIQAKETNGGTARLIIGRESKDRGPYTCTKMVVASLAVFTKMLSVEDVPYAFTYGDTVAASYRWLMTGLEKGIIRGAPEIEQRQSLIDVDGGIYVDGETGWFEITDFDDLFMDPAKAKHGFAVSFKVKFDQRVREYKEPKYIIDTGGNVDGIRGVSVYILNDNLYFRVVSTPDEDTMIWKVRTPIYTVRWQQVVFTWRLDKGLWVYLDGSFRGYTKVPETLPGTSKDVAKRFYVGRKIIGTPVGGAQFAFGCLALYTRFLNKQDCENVFGGIDNPFPGIIREVWKNTPGENLKALQANPDFPNNPTTIEIIENFDSPFNVDGNYGSKLKGYFIAPETGNSTFYLSCSRSCELNFSPDEEAKNKTKIISLKKSTWHNQWNKYENQTSKEIFLVAGKYYYLEAVHKGVDASDSLSVGVRMPTGRYQRPISKENLQWRLPGNQHAGLIREVWYNIPGYTIADLTSNSNFPNRPSSTEILDKFDAPFNVDDNYGSRISGYFHAPETGDFRFYLSSDSSGELWISSDESESNLVKIISLNGWTDHNQWLKYPEQKSDKIFLASGRYYYIRVYMKADKLGDCASVAVELPSGHFEGPIKKKHLSWKISGTKDGPGPGEIIEAMPKAIGLFPLDEKSYKNEQAIGKPSLIISDVELTTGPGGLKDNAFLFKGKASSFVQIPNKKGDLDAKDSITILANIYPTGQDGPIINYKKDGWGVHLWQFSGSQLFVRFVTREGHMSTQPLGTRVLELNKWNQVGASYDKNSGVAQLWHDGKMVKSRNIGQVELLTNAPIRLGAREGDDRYFQGKISCVQIYNKALKEQQIGELRKCPKQTEGSQSQSDNDDLSMFSQGSGVQPAFEDIEALENRLGDDTEEELIVQGERNQATRCEPNPCVNNGVCIDDDKKIDGYVCSCSSDFTGKRCQVSRPAAENPVVKRTEIPKGYEEKNNVHAFSSSVEDNDGSEKNEDIPLLYQKVGCFKDDPTNHDLKRPVKLQQLTQERCAKACALDDKGFSYFGLQNGTSCYCGRNYGKYGKVSDGECNKNCEGNSDETCGGASSNNVYFFGLGTNYTIKTFTGKKLGAGTDAKIYLELIGERGSSDFRKLEDGIEKFEPGSVDTQKFVLPDLGRLKRMRILHDNTGTAPSWYLEKVEVSDENERKFEFDCNDWLSDTQSGGKLERELQARTLP